MNDLMKDNAEYGPGSTTMQCVLKSLFKTAHTLAFYDPTKPTMVSADVSGYGICGYILQQQEDNPAGQSHIAL